MGVSLSETLPAVLPLCLGQNLKIRSIGSRTRGAGMLADLAWLPFVLPAVCVTPSMPRPQHVAGDGIHALEQEGY